MLHNLVPKVEGKSKYDTITYFLKCLKKGHIGTKQDGTKFNDGIPVDLKVENNTLGFFVVINGWDMFSTNSFSQIQVEEKKFDGFSFGDKPTVDGVIPTSPSKQKDLVKKAMGKQTNATTNTGYCLWKLWYNTKTVPSTYTNYMEQVCFDHGTNQETLRKCIHFCNKLPSEISLSTQSSRAFLEEPAQQLPFSVDNMSGFYVTR